jgi:PAS domain S-box-containing protein
MAPNAAGCAILASVSLWLLRREDSQSFGAAERLAAKTVAGIITLVGLLSLTEHLFDLNFGIDRLLLVTPLNPQTAGARVLMSPVAAGFFFLFGCALLGIDWRTQRGDWPAQFLSIGAMIGAAFGMFGLILGPVVSPITLALPAVVSYFMLASGLLCARPNWAVGGLLARQSPGASLVRKAAPAALLVLSLVGLLISRALLTESHFTWVEVSVLGVFCSALLAGFIVWTAFLVERGEAERKKIEVALHADKEQLDRLLDRIEEPQDEKLLRRNVNAGFAVAVLLTVLLGALSWRASQQAAKDADWVAHTHEVSATLELTLRHLDDVETGGRGFALTGHEPFLEPYETGKYAVGQDLQALRLLTIDNPDQKRRLDVLVQQANARIEASSDLVAFRRNSGVLPTVAQLERGRQLMDEARVTVQKMETEENRLLEERARRARAAQRSNNSAIGLGLIVGVIFLSLAGTTVSREIKVSARARAQVNALNANLERRVEQRTSALQSEIVARAAIDAKLRASEEMFRTLLDGIKDYAVYMLDLEGHVMSWNSGAVRIKGYLADEIIGKDFSSFYAETDRDLRLPRESLRTAAQTGRFEGQGWRVRKDGSKFWADVVITPLYEADGALRGYSKVVRDATERKRTEDELKKQATLLDLAHDAILVRNLKNQVIFWNRGAQNIYGWSTEEALGKVTHDFLQTKFPQPLDTIEAELASKGDWEGELRHRTSHGTEVIVASRWSLQRDERGLPAAILEINRDITDRKQGEQALSDSEGRLAGIIASAMDSIITVDDEQRIVLFNCAAEKVFRCPVEEAMGQPLTRFIPERFHASHAEHIRKFGKTGVTNREMGPKDVLWALRADGQEFQIEASISHVVTGGKKLFTVILRDVTERKQAEEIRERLAAVVESSDDAIISKDLNGTINAWNRGAEKVFGYSSAEALGKPMVMLFLRDRVNEESHILTRIRRGESVEHYETERLRKDGATIVVSVTISPIRDGAGAVVGASTIARDITGRRRVEEALRESEEKLRLALDGARLGTWHWNLDNDELEGSPPSLALFGLPPDTKFNFAGFRATLHPDDRIRVDEAMKRSLAGESEYDIEYRTIWPDGTEHWIAAKGRVYKNAAGENTHMGGILFDVTERHRVEDALRNSEDRFQAMANGIPQLAWIAEADGHIFWYNRRWYGYTGTTFEQMEGWAWQAVHDPAMLPAVMEKWKSAIATGQPFDMEFPLRGADGLFRTFLTRGMPLKDPEGHVVRWFGTNTDISERKVAEERLSRQAKALTLQAEELLRSQSELESKTRMLNLVLESMGEGLVAADREGQFLLWNGAASKLLCREAASLPPEQWSAHYACYLPDGVTLCPTDRLPLVRALQGESLQQELIIRRPGSEETALLEFSGHPLKDANASVCGGVVAFRDITQRKKDEQEIRKLNEELEQKVRQRTAQLEAVNHELEAFTYSVSHDLRAPIRHISSFSKILSDDFGSAMDPEARRLLERIDNGARRMTLLVEGLLSLSRIGPQSLKLSLTELNAVVDGVISVLQPQCEGRDVEWRVAKLPALECDPILIGQVFQNLIGNALKYSGRRTKAVIEIDSTRQTGKPPVIFVRDNGAGFSMQYADKLFGVFQRMHKDSEFEGTGVGLATVHRIIQKHGGSIWAEAEVDRGATFYFTVGEKAPIESIQGTTKNGALEHVHDS